MEITSVSVEEVANAFQESLDRLGRLDHIRASLRYEVYQCLQQSLQLNNGFNRSNDDENSEYNKCGDGDDNNSKNHIHNIPTPREVELCHALIVDYLHCRGFVHTLSTFKAEMKGKQHRKDDYNGEYDDGLRRRIKKELNLEEQICHENSKEDKEQATVPLLFQIVTSLRHNQDASSNQSK